MATLSGKLIQFAKNNDYTGFEKEYLIQNPGKTPTDASLSFTGHKSAILSQNTNSGSGSSSVKTSIGEGISGVISNSQSKLSDDFIKFDGSSIMKMLSGKQNFAAMAIDQVADAAASYASQQTALLTTMNKELGMTGTLSKEYRNDITNGITEAKQYGVGFDEMLKSIKDIQDSTGKFTLLSSKTIEEMGKVSNLVGGIGKVAEYAPFFEKVGLGVSDMSKILDKNAHSSLNLGLNAVKMADTTNKNMDKINNYGFKNGIEGLSKMAQKATEFRMDMESSFKLAEKVMDPSGAIDMVANLQMIGGAFGDMNDPLKMMYMATNNVEGLQDAIIGSAKSLATYNQEQGRFEITGANIRRAREMSTAMGIDYKELNNIAVAAQERMSASADLMANGLVFKNDDDKEFLTNLSHMKDGKMVIDVPEGLQTQFDNVKEGSIALEDMSQKQIEVLLAQKKEFEKKTDIEIMQSQLTVLSNVAVNVSYLLELTKTRVGRTVTKVAEQKLGIDPEKMNETIRKLTNYGKEDIIKTDNVVKEFLGVDKQKPKNPNGIAKQQNSPVNLDQPKVVKPEQGNGSNNTIKNVKLDVDLRSSSTFTDQLSRLVMDRLSPKQMGDFLSQPFKF